MTRPARKHQQEALDKMNGHRAFALLMAMRTGKTKVLVDGWQQTGGDLLVIAPAGAYRTWETEIPKDADNVCTFTWTSGRANNSNDFLLHKGPRALLVNVEALSAVEEARALCVKFLRSSTNCTVAVDESVVIKNPSAKRTKFINWVLAPLATRRRILSGLPTPRSPLDLYAQFEFLDRSILGFKDYFAFRWRYAVMKKIKMGGRTIPIVVGYKNVEELWQKIEPYSYRCRLEDCYDLPPSTYAFRDVTMTPEQRRMYEEIKKYATTRIESDAHVTATEVVTQMLRLHQVLCGHTRDEQGNWHAIPETRTSTLIDLLDDYDGKAVIWCSYDSDVRKVSEALAKHFDCPVARFWGGNRPTREAEELTFKTDPTCRFMVATPDAGGRGRTWDCASLVVYYSNRDNLDLRMQSEERPKAVNKADPISYVDLRVPGTVDDKIIGALRAKINMADAITGDNWREWLV